MSIIHGMPEAEYHAHPALSSTGARQLLVSPKTFQYAQSNPQPHKDAFDLGTAVHTKVLGVGERAIGYPAEHLTPSGAVSTKADTKQWLAEQRAAGKIVLDPVKLSQVDAMAEAVLAHREARVLFEQEGDSEQSVFATDPETGVDLRARFDFLPNFMQTDPIAVDLKTTGRKADRESFSNQVADLGYDVQDAHYLHTYALASGDPTLRMKFVVVETTPPHLVAVHDLSLEFAEIGAARARHARHLFAACTKTGEWPGYGENHEPLQPPLRHIYQNQGLLQ